MDKRLIAKKDTNSIDIVDSDAVLILRKQISDLELQLKNLIQVEQDLRESQENFQDIFETAKEGIAYTTLRGKLLAINGNLEKILGKVIT
jgi:PAS domain-containing protein